MSRQNRVRQLDGKFAVGFGPGTDARTNRCYNEQGSRTSYIRTSIPHYNSFGRNSYLNPKGRINDFDPEDGGSRILRNAGSCQTT